MQLLLSERWILLADVTNSTHFFWELAQAGAAKPDALFETSCIYSGNMESIFSMMANVPEDWLVAKLGNTMGDGFILVGRHGHGAADHIREDAAKVLYLAKCVKEQCDSILDRIRQTVSETLSRHGTDRELPELKMKVTLHHGYLVTMKRSERFFGDTVNYCARVASAAFAGWSDGVVLTGKFLDVLQGPLRDRVRGLEHSITLRYPKKTETQDVAYRISIAEKQVWSEVEQLAAKAP